MKQILLCITEANKGPVTKVTATGVNCPVYSRICVVARFIVKRLELTPESAKLMTFQVV